MLQIKERESCLNYPLQRQAPVEPPPVLQLSQLTPSSSTTTATSPTPPQTINNNNNNSNQNSNNTNKSDQNNESPSSSNDLLKRKRSLEVEATEIELNHKKTVIQFNQGMAKCLSENDLAKFAMYRKCFDTYMATYAQSSTSNISNLQSSLSHTSLFKKPMALIKVEGEEENEDEDVTFLSETAPPVNFARLKRTVLHSPLPVGDELRRKPTAAATAAAASSNQVVRHRSSTSRPALLHVRAYVNAASVELSAESMRSTRVRLLFKSQEVKQCGCESTLRESSFSCDMMEPHYHCVFADSKSAVKKSDYTRSVIRGLGIQYMVPMRSITAEQYNYVVTNF
jgi:hypothetical protein